MDLVGFAGGVVKPLGKIELEDGLESSPSSVLNDTLHDKVSHFERYRNPGHAGCDQCRMPETRKEAKEQKGSQSRKSPGRGRFRKSRFNRTYFNQPGISESAGYDKGKPVGRMQDPIDNEILNPFKYIYK
ncbi:hypothetical protein Tco_0765563 [Tanacetum coccineum]